MSADIAIRVKNLSKKYTLKHPVEDAAGHIIKEHWALQDISFEIKKGEAVGIIGPNGSGKSTLLKILSGITKPTSGTVEISGRVASILDIGAGFHQELSGRENVFLNGQLLGFSYKEIKNQYAHIVAFSGIGTYIEEPVKNYSSGMYLRLAFSILVHLHFDIYLFDEVMNVGDASFQIKVKQFLQQKMQQATFIFVSHHLAEVQSLCSSLYLLNNGVMRKDEPNELIDDYISVSFDKGDPDLPLNRKLFDADDINENEFFDLQQVSVNTSEDGRILESEPIAFLAELKIKKQCRTDISFGVESLLGNELLYVSTLFNETSFSDHPFTADTLIIKTQIPAYTLKKGKYVLSITMIVNQKTIISRYKSCHFQISTHGTAGNKQIDQRPHVVIITGDWSVLPQTTQNQ